MYHQSPRDRTVLAGALLGAVVGGIVGLIVGRAVFTGTNDSELMSELVKLLSHGQAEGPIIAAGLAAASSIVGAALVPAVTVYTLEKLRKEKGPNK